MSDPSVTEDYLVIPESELSEEALYGLVDAFVLREGTDYGKSEKTLSQKRNAVLHQLTQKKLVIVYDPYEQSSNIMTKDQLQSLQKRHKR